MFGDKSSDDTARRGIGIESGGTVAVLNSVGHTDAKGGKVCMYWS